MSRGFNITSRLRTTWRWIPELPVVLALFVTVGGVWLFAEVTDEVIDLETQDVDHAILQVMRSAEDPRDPWGPQWMERAAVDITAMGGYSVMTIVVLSVVGYLALKHQWGNAGLIVLTTLAGLGLTHLLKASFARARPDVVPHMVEVITESYPSGHAMMSAVVYLSLGALLAQVSQPWQVKIYVISLAVLMTLLIGTSRIYLGVHFPSDVLAGWSLGAAWAATAWMAAWMIRKKVVH